MSRVFLVCIAYTQGSNELKKITRHSWGNLSRTNEQTYYKHQRRQEMTLKSMTRYREHPLDWLSLSLLSICSWCVVSALAPLSCGSRRIIQVDAAHWWWLRRDPPPPHDCKALWVYNNTQKVLYKCIIHSFIHSTCNKNKKDLICQKSSYTFF